jgi:hypothetical protein
MLNKSNWGMMESKNKDPHTYRRSSTDLSWPDQLGHSTILMILFRTKINQQESLRKRKCSNWDTKKLEIL